MSPSTVGLAILLLGVVALVGKYIRVRSGLLQRLFLPVAIISGFLALLLGPEVLGRLAGLAGIEALAGGGVFSAEVLDVWSSLPGLLISVVFATLFLGQRIPSPKRAVALLGPQLSLGVTFASGQYVIGILLAILLLVPLFSVNPLFGTLIEIGFEGGHGTAAGMAPVMAELGFPEGADLALAMATVGIASGVIIGVFAANWAARRGHSTQLDAKVEVSEAERRGIYGPNEEQPSGGRLTVHAASLETLTLHLGIVGLAILIGQGMLSGVQAIEALLWAHSVEVFAYVPLFPLAMLGGVIIQLVADRYEPLGRLIDRGTMERVQGLGLDLLIIAALATLSLATIADNVAPFAILAASGIAWNVFVLFVLAPRLIRAYWFERGIGDFGQSMGVTATGLLLIRMADPKGKTPAYEAFGYKQLVFEPFFGGGLITAASIPLIVQFGPYPFLVVMLVLLAASLLSGFFYFGKNPRFTSIKANGGEG